MVYYDWTTIQVSSAMRSALTAWRNADVKLATAECQGVDELRSCFITLPTKQTTRRGTAARIKTRDTTSRIDGLYLGNHRFQTAQFIYYMMQGCTTVENTPAGYNTHTITLGTTNTPINLGIHAQHKPTGEELYWDMLGMLPESLVITCSEKQRLAEQSIRIPFAYANTAGDDFTKTYNAGGTTGLLYKNWDHAVAGGLGGSQTAFTYNSVAVGVAIIGIRIEFTRAYSFYARDSTGYWSDGEVYTMDYKVILDVIPTKTDIWDIIQLDKDSYAGDLDLDFKFQADATNDYIRFLFDKLYLDPLDKQMTYDQYVDAYQLTLTPMSDSSSLTVTAVDGHNNNYYEDP